MNNPERLDPKIGIIKKLFALSGNVCAYPGCQQCIIDADSDIIYGQMCHIEAANPGGERFNPDQTNEERRSFENLILLCANHHLKTNNVQKYTVDVLKKMKSDHEAKFQAETYLVTPSIEQTITQHFTKKLDEIYALTLDTNCEVRGMRNELQEFVSLFTASIGRQVVDDRKLYEDRLDFVRTLRAAGKPSSALYALERFEQDNWNNLDPEWKYKVTANKGIQLLDLGRKKEGAEQFISIANIPYESGDASGFICLGYALLNMREEFDQYFPKALSTTSDNINLWLAYLRIYGRNSSYAELISKLPETVREDPLILFYIGQIQYEIGNVALGISLMEQAISHVDCNAPTNWQWEGILIGAKLKCIITPLSIAFQAASESERIILCDAIVALNSLLSKLEGTEVISMTYTLVLNRGICHRILGDIDSAILDFEKAWQIAKYPDVFKQLANIYIVTNNHTRARHLVSERHLIQHEDNIDMVEIELVISRIELATGNYHTALNNLVSCLDLEHVSRIKVLNAIILIALEGENNEDAMQYARIAVVEFPEDTEAWLFMGTCYNNFGNREKAISVFDHVATLLEMKRPSIVDWYYLGLEYFQIKEYAKAVKCLEKVANGDRIDDANWRLLFSYFNNTDYNKAIEFGLKLRRADPTNPKVLEILLRTLDILEIYDEFDQLIQLSMQVGQPKAKDHFRLLGVVNYVKRGDYTKAAKLSAEIELPAELELEQQFYIAGVLFRESQFEKGINIMLGARQKFYDTPKSHQLFVESWLTYIKNDSIVYFLESVTDDCGITMVDLRNRETRYFLTSDKSCSGPHFLHPEDNLYKLVFGQSKDQIIFIPNSGGASGQLRIKEILTKPTFAFRESLDLLEKKYPGSTGLFFYDLKT